MSKRSVAIIAKGASLVCLVVASVGIGALLVPFPSALVLVMDGHPEPDEVRLAKFILLAGAFSCLSGIVAIGIRMAHQSLLRQESTGGRRDGEET